jgi:hypothetical protein
MHATQLQRDDVSKKKINESEAYTLDSFQKAIGASKVANPISCLFVIFLRHGLVQNKNNNFHIF